MTHKGHVPTLAETHPCETNALLQQLTLYGQKFDEFQATLAKSNEIYVRFKKEMDNVGDDSAELQEERSWSCLTF